MCIVFFVFGRGPPQPKLLLAFNRDEYFERRTQPLHEWEDSSGLLAGRDLEGGGTWLGVNARTGRVAFLTNLRSRDPVEPSTRVQKQHTSRGELPTGFLNGSMSPLEFVQSLRLEQYHGFNLVVGDLRYGPRVGAFAYVNNGEKPDANGNNNGQKPDANGNNNGRNVNGGSSNESHSSTPSASKRQIAAAGPLFEGEGEAGPNRGDEATRGGAGPPGASGSEGRAEAGLNPGAAATAAPGAQVLEPGRVYGLSNGVLMEWPKVVSGVRLMEDMLADITEEAAFPWDRLFSDLLGDTTRLVPPPDTRAGHQPSPPPPPPALQTVAGGGAATPPPPPAPAQPPAQPTAPEPPVPLGGSSTRAAGGSAEPGSGRQQETQEQGSEAGDVCVKAVVQGLAKEEATKKAVRAAGDPVAATAAVASAAGAVAESGAGAAAASGVGGGSGQAAKRGIEYFARNLEHLTSGRFVEIIDSPFGLYGTRSQTVILVRHDGSAEIRERHLGTDGVWSETTLAFQLQLQGTQQAAAL